MQAETFDILSDQIHLIKQITRFVGSKCVLSEMTATVNILVSNIYFSETKMIQIACQVCYHTIETHRQAFMIQKC